jgi:hypothetical protein
MATAKRKRADAPRASPEQRAPLQKVSDDGDLLGKTDRQLQEMTARFETPNGAEKVWEDVFSDTDRKKLGNKLNEAWREHGTVGMASKVWRCSRDEALIRLCEECGSYDAATLRRMRRDKNLVVATNRKVRRSRRPRWNKEKGELQYEGKVVRCVRIGVATHVMNILDHFELENWPRRIDSPLHPNKGVRVGPKGDSATLRDAIKSLNTGLTGIEFCADGRGLGVTWKEV